MKYLKSLFISSYMMLLMALAGYAVWNLDRGASLLAWSGVLLTSAPLLLVIGRLMLWRNMARTSAHFPLFAMNSIGNWRFSAGRVPPSPADCWRKSGDDIRSVVKPSAAH